MNFYFRRGRDAEFWSWVTKALSMSDSSVNAIFRLAWERSDNNSFIASHIPDRPDLITEYFYFLAETNRLDQAGDIAARAVARAPETAFPAFISYCSRYAETATRQALSVWNTLCKRRALPFKPLDPPSGAILTNADYSLDPTERAFDWRPGNVDGVLLERGEAGSGIRLELSGNQPEDCTLLTQILPTARGKTYELAWTSNTGPAQTVAGLAWEVNDKDGTLARGAIAGEPSGAAGTLTFHSENDSVRLLLRYRRPLGSVRARGTVTISGLRTRVLP
jgi:hypothetical protein